MAGICITSGCSWEVDFVIVNVGNTPVIVRYEFKPYVFAGRFEVPKPSVKPAAEIRGFSYDWPKPDRSTYDLDEDTGLVEIELAPKMGVRITRGLNLSGALQVGDVDLHAIEIESATAAATYLGLSVPAAFEERRRRLYVLEFP